MTGTRWMISSFLGIAALPSYVAAQTADSPLMGGADGSESLPAIPYDSDSDGETGPQKLDSEAAFHSMCGLTRGLANAVDMHYSMWNQSIESTNDHNCTLAIEMIYIARQHIKDALTQIHQNFTANHKSNPDDSQGNKAAWVAEAVSIAASYATASTHITGGVFNKKGKCLPHELRLLFMVTQRRARNLALSELKQLWLEFQGTPRDAKISASNWINEALSLFDSDARTMQSLIETRGQPEGPIYLYDDNTNDGVMNVMEGLRQDSFEDWPMDKPVLKGILKYGTKSDDSIADFGAGSGFVTRWFNKTALVHGQAFDAIPGIHMSSAGAVQFANLTAPQFLQRFDWVTAFHVLDVIPEDSRQTFLENVGRHAKEGAVLTWLSGNAPVAEDLIVEWTGLQVDRKLTTYLRMVSDMYGNGIIALRRDENTSPWKSDAGHQAANIMQATKDKVEFDRREEEACGTTRHLESTIYRGHDLEMLEEIAGPRECCARCWTYGGCKYWTYSAHDKSCYLKSWKDKIMEGKEGFTSGHYWVHGDPYDERNADTEL